MRDQHYNVYEEKQDPSDALTALRRGHAAEGKIDGTPLTGRFYIIDKKLTVTLTNVPNGELPSEMESPEQLFFKVKQFDLLKPDDFDTLKDDLASEFYQLEEVWEDYCDNPRSDSQQVLDAVETLVKTRLPILLRRMAALPSVVKKIS